MNLVNVNEDFNRDDIVKSIRTGKIFIYPTDTIYGIGCDATNTESVRRLRVIKNRDKKPFSVIAPSKDWILTQCLVDEKELDLLPGPYTFFMSLKDKKAVSEAVNPGLDTLGVRIPDHWFSDIVAEARVPFVTTSVNFAGEPHMEKLDDAKEEIKETVDLIIYEGEIHGEPSIKINLIKQKGEK